MVPHLPSGVPRSLGWRLMAFAREQLRLAHLHLGHTGEARHVGIHQARKCIRRARATLALGARIFGPRAQRLDDELGRLCRGLSPLRDAQALIETLRRLTSTAPAPVQAILPLAEREACQRRDQLLQRALTRDPEFMARRHRLLVAQTRLERLDWWALDAAVVSAAVMRSGKRAGKAAHSATHHPDDNHAWHVYRRRLRRLHQQDTLLADIEPELRPVLVQNLQKQASLLGESQDDALLLAHTGSRSPFPPGQRKLLRSMARERLQRTRRGQARM